MEEKYLKIVIHAPSRELFSYLQQNIFYEDVEMFYIPDLSEIEEFTKRIRPHLFITVISSEFLLNDKALLFFKSPQMKDTGRRSITGTPRLGCAGAFARHGVGP